MYIKIRGASYSTTILFEDYLLVNYETVKEKYSSKGFRIGGVF